MADSAAPRTDAAGDTPSDTASTPPDGATSTAPRRRRGSRRRNRRPFAGLGLAIDPGLEGVLAPGRQLARFEKIFETAYFTPTPPIARFLEAQQRETERITKQFANLAFTPAADYAKSLQRVSLATDRWLPLTTPILAPPAWSTWQMPTTTVLRPLDGFTAALRPLDGFTAALRPLDGFTAPLRQLAGFVDQAALNPWTAFGEDLWREFIHAGQRMAFWAVQAAIAAVHAGDLDEVAEFVQYWLDYKPTQPRVDATVEVLLEPDLVSCSPDQGKDLLDEVRRRVRARYPMNRLLVHTDLRAGRLISLDELDEPLLRQPGPAIEDLVLDHLQPDVDARQIELIKQQSPSDRQILMVKYATGCSWAAAATACGLPDKHGEVLRRRLTRQRDRLAALDPHPSQPASQLGGYGRIPADWEIGRWMP